jgi:uncharacterized protein (TIGR02246 family)
MNTTLLTRTVLFTALLISSAAYAKGQQAPDVKEALKQWEITVESGTLQDIMKLYDKNAIMISTFAQTPLTSRSQLEDYFRQVIENPDIDVKIEESHPRVFGDMAVNSGRYTLSYTQDGEPVSIPARFSFVYVLRKGQWVIVDHHSSRMPRAEELK